MAKPHGFTVAGSPAVNAKGIAVLTARPPA